ncbi:MAG: C2H2-type zinc finger protein, partial [Bacteroidota bacterium]
MLKKYLYYTPFLLLLTSSLYASTVDTNNRLDRLAKRIEKINRDTKILRKEQKLNKNIIARRYVSNPYDKIPLLIQNNFIFVNANSIEKSNQLPSPSISSIHKEGHKKSIIKEERFVKKEPENKNLLLDSSQFTTSSLVKKKRYIKQEKFIKKEPENKNFPKISTLIHKEKKPNKRKKCDKKYSINTPTLISQKPASKAKKIYKCHICGKISSGKSNLTRHIRIHTG